MKLSTYAMKLRKKYKIRKGAPYLCNINDKLLANLCYNTASIKLKQEYQHYNYIIYNYIQGKIDDADTVESFLYTRIKTHENPNLDAHKFRTKLLENMIEEFKEREEGKEMITYSTWLKKLATNTLVEYQKYRRTDSIFICLVLNYKETRAIPNDDTPWIDEYVIRLRKAIEDKLELEYEDDYTKEEEHSFKMPSTLEAKQNWLLEQSKIAKKKK